MTRRRAQPAPRRLQRGGFVMGLVAGLLVGLALALAVALYITKAPVPFIDKVPQRTAEQDQAELEKNRSWDPNAPLGGKPPKPLVDPAAAAMAASAAAAASAVAALPPVVASGPAAAKPAARDPAAILAGAPTPPVPAKPGAEPFIFFVQAGAYTRPEDAEQQKAKLAMLGQEAKVSEREQAGRVVYRVRVGPFPTRDVADDLQGRLQQQGVESQIVRVERP